jgi:hypothetical protein
MDNFAHTTHQTVGDPYTVQHIVESSVPFKALICCPSGLLDCMIVEHDGIQYAGSVELPVGSRLIIHEDFR